MISFGVLVGYLDEETHTKGSTNLLRLTVTEDGKYCFVGCRAGPRIVMCIKLDNLSDNEGIIIRNYINVYQYIV